LAVGHYLLRKAGQGVGLGFDLKSPYVAIDDRNIDTRSAVQQP
jgi:hypothetical protein